MPFQLDLVDQNEKVEAGAAAAVVVQELTPMTRRNFLKTERIKAFQKFAFGGAENSPASAKRVRCNSEMMPPVTEENCN